MQTVKERSELTEHFVVVEVFGSRNRSKPELELGPRAWQKADAESVFWSHPL